MKRPREFSSDRLPMRYQDALDELAVDMKTDPAGVLYALVEASLKDDALFARSILKVTRRGLVAVAA